jgi:hypothetical protein
MPESLDMGCSVPPFARRLRPMNWSLQIGTHERAGCATLEACSCLPPLASNANAFPSRTPCRGTAALLPSLNAAERNLGPTGVSSAPNSCARPSSSASAHPLSFWAKAFYEARSAKGQSHNAIIRALAFKWLRILWRYWVDRKPYDETRYLLALRKRHSPLVGLAAPST